MQKRFGPEKMRYHFFLNSHKESAFTRCPNCEAKTLIRKFPLVIDIEPQQIFVLNKKCQYCKSCDLIIAHKHQVETLMAASFENKKPEIIGNDYQVIGTLKKSVWRDRNSIKNDIEVVENILIFNEIWYFKPTGNRWCPSKRC